MKLFIVNIANRNLIINFVTFGFLETEFKAYFAALIPSWFGNWCIRILHLR